MSADWTVYGTFKLRHRPFLSCAALSHVLVIAQQNTRELKLTNRENPFSTCNTNYATDRPCNDADCVVNESWLRTSTATASRSGRQLTLRQSGSFPRGLIANQT